MKSRLPFPLMGSDTNNGGEFNNHALTNSAGDRDLFFAKARPNNSKDNAHVE